MNINMLCTNRGELVKKAINNAAIKEQIIANYFQELGYEIQRNFDDSCDLILDPELDNPICIEIKEQISTSKKYNKICVEISRKGNPSGLVSPNLRAHYWIEIIHFRDGSIRAYMTSVSILKDIIRKSRSNNEVVERYAGDKGSQTKVLDIPITKDFLSNFVELKRIKFNSI